MGPTFVEARAHWSTDKGDSYPSGTGAVRIAQSSLAGAVNPFSRGFT